MVFASLIPELKKDTRYDAFIPEDYPALIFRDQNRDLFGLEGPIVIAIGRALFFNFVALALGSGVLYSSKVIILQEFGLLVTVAITASYVINMTVLPALLKVIQPRFLTIKKSQLTIFIKHCSRRIAMNNKYNKLPKTALITGASGGIGYEFCRLFARDKVNLVLVARNEPKLKQVSDQLHDDYGIQTHIFALDLAMPDAAWTLYQMLNDKKLHIDYLINNAGVGNLGQFASSDFDTVTNMLNLNITALVQLTRLMLPEMLQQGSGRILNVSSLAGFQPGGPNAAVYYASKNFVLAFNRALVVELKHTSVTSTAFCPGPLTTTFVKQSGFSETRLYRFFSGDVKKSVSKAYRDLMKGKTTIVPGLLNKLLAIGGEIQPRFIALTINKFLLQT